MIDTILCFLNVSLSRRAFLYKTLPEGTFFERAQKHTKAFKAALRTAAALQFDGCDVVAAAVLALIKAEYELDQADELSLELICADFYSENRNAHARPAGIIDGWKAQAFSELSQLRSCLRDKLDALLADNQVHPLAALYLRLHAEEAPRLSIATEYVPSPVLTEIVAYMAAQAYQPVSELPQRDPHPSEVGFWI